MFFNYSSLHLFLKNPEKESYESTFRTGYGLAATFNLYFLHKYLIKINQPLSQRINLTLPTITSQY